MGAAQSTPGAPAHTGAPGVPPIQITLNLADVLQGLSLPVQQAGTAVPAGGGTGGTAPPTTGMPAPGVPEPVFPPEPPAAPEPAAAPAPAEGTVPSEYLRVCQKCGERSYVREKVCLNEYCQAWNCCES